MLIFLLILLTLLFLLFISIPIRFKIMVNLNEIKVYLFDKKLNLGGNKKAKSSKNFSFIKIASLKYKPVVNLNLNLEYGFGDAAYTGIFYGIFSAALPILHEKVSLYININKHSYYLKPNYDKQLVNIMIDGIIKLNLAKAIYIFIVINFNKRKL